jgi:hypothetical protein
VYIGTQPAIGQNRKLDSIAASFNGVLTTFNLTVSTASIVPSNVYQLFISLGGVLQNPGVDFTANGNQITFTTAPTAGLSFFGIFQGDSITGTPTIADASITTLKLATGLTVTHAAGTAGAPSITFAGDLANGAFAPAANTFGISTAGTERLRIDSSGRLLAGTSTARNNFFGTTLSAVAQVEGTGGATGRGALSVINNDVSNNPPYVLLGRSGAASLGSNAAVVSGSRLGTLTFHGADGTSFIEAATVAGEVDGTPGTNDMPGRLVFSTTADGAASPTERMRISSNGNVGIGAVGVAARLAATSTGTDYAGYFSYPVSTGQGIGINSTGVGGSNAVFFFNNGATVGSISTSSSSTSYNTSSDYRLKENVVPLTGAVNRLNQLQVHRFNFIADPDKIVDGFIAHEAQAVVPECVTGTKDEVDADGNPVYQGIDQSKLVPLLTAALREAMERIETLEAKVAALEGQ